MQTWQMQTAKARFSARVKSAADDGTQKSPHMADRWR